MIVLHFSLGFLFVFVAVDGYYYRSRTHNYQNSVPTKRKYVYKLNVHEYAQADEQWQQNYNNRQQSIEARRTPARRNNEKGPRRTNTISRTEEYQRQRTTAVRNTEKGPRNDNRRSRTEEYQRQRTTAVRNTEKGPRRDRGRSRTEVYQRQNTVVRNNEKGPRGDRGGSRTEEYQRQRTKTVRNTEKGPRNDNRRSRTEDYQRQRTTTVRNTEKGPRGDRGGSSTQQYQRQNTRAVRNNEKGPRRDNRRSRIDDYQRQNNVRRATAVLNYEKERSYNRRTSNSENSIQTFSTLRYQGCKDVDRSCSYWIVIGACKLEFGRKYCAKTCGFCAPMSPVCPRTYKYGCCWDGRKATDRRKRNCSPCKDLSDIICHRYTIKKDCDFHEPNSLTTRSLCPRVCGACSDYQ